MQAAPLRFPPWFTAATDESKVFNHGTKPFEWPLVPLIKLPRERTREKETPIPPANFESSAISLYLS
jgi:hypothetical protein